MTPRDKPLYEKHILVGKARRSPDKVESPANCDAVVTIELHNVRDGIELSICGAIWNSRRTDIFMGGQCLPSMPEYISNWIIPQTVFERMCEVSERWHLNGLKAGCVHQRALMPLIQRLRGDDYFHTKNYDEVVKLPFFRGCPFCDGYIYGSAWLHEELPAEIVKEVKSW